MRSWSSIWPQVVTAVSQSRTREEAVARASAIRGGAVTWAALARAGRRQGVQIADWLGTDAPGAIRPVPTAEGQRHLFLPDTQCQPGVPLNHLAWAGAYAAELQPDTVIIGGDWWDMPSLSPYDKPAAKMLRGATRRSDIDAGNKAAELFHNAMASRGFTPKRVVFIEGNHDGFSPLGRCGRHLIANPDEDTLVPDLFADSWLGWERIPFPKPFEVDGVLYCHLYGSSKWGSPSAKAQMSLCQQSCVSGHKPGLDLHCHPRPGRDLCRWSAIAGSFYQHDEAYRGQNHYWRGLLVLNDVQPTGEFDPLPVSLRYLKRKFG